MVTERYISHRHISSCMTGYYAGGSSQENSFDYQTFLNNSFTGNPFFDAFITELSGEMQIYDGINPYVLDALRPLITKADSFLRRHAHMSYEEFLKRSKPETFTKSDYGILPAKKNLKRRLFEHRSLLYLSSLDDCERLGHTIDDILLAIKHGVIPTIKKELNEPTFEEILAVLGKKY